MPADEPLYSIDVTNTGSDDVEILSEEHLLAILVEAQEISGIVIGGQALNLWADLYLDPEDYETLGPFTSKDLDFWGHEAAARALAERLAGTLLLPDREDNSTPSSAAVRVTLDGVTHQIDFLKIVCGLDVKRMLDRAQAIQIDGGVRVDLLHPIDVLVTRVSGVTTLRRRDLHALRQLRAAPIILRNFITTLLEDGEVDEAQDLVSEFIEIASQTYLDESWENEGIDLIAIAHELAARPEWDARFAHYNIDQRCTELTARRGRRVAESKRRRARLGG